MLISNQVFTKKEAAEYLKINPQVMERYLRQGKVPGRKVGRQWRISRLALDLWLSPSIVNLFKKLINWEQIFQLGDQIGKQIKMSEEDISQEVTKLRRERGINISTGTGH